jgi:pyruvate-formate lyase-activating enzyme
MPSSVWGAPLPHVPPSAAAPPGNTLPLPATEQSEAGWHQLLQKHRPDATAAPELAQTQSMPTPAPSRGAASNPRTHPLDAPSPWRLAAGLARVLNPKLSRLRKVATLHKAASEPKRLMVAVTQQCQMSCKTCYGHSPLLANKGAQNVAANDKAPPMMTLETFRFLLDQVPWVKSVTFSGWGEPLLSPDLWAMVDLAWERLGAPSTVVTNGLLIEDQLNTLIRSHVAEVHFSLKAHKPSLFGQLTGMHPQVHPQLIQNLQNLLSAKRRNGLAMRVSVVFLTTRDTLGLIPEQIAFAESLGADGVIFESLMPMPGLQVPGLGSAHGRPQAGLNDMFTKVLRNDDMVVRDVLAQIKQQHYRIQVTLPTLVSGMSNPSASPEASPAKTIYALPPTVNQAPGLGSTCPSVMDTLTVDPEGYSSVCEKQLVFDGRMGQIWNADFWTNDRVAWLRDVHQAASTAKHAQPKSCTAPATDLTLPWPCQQCTHRFSHTQQVLLPG